MHFLPVLLHWKSCHRLLVLPGAVVSFTTKESEFPWLDFALSCLGVYCPPTASPAGLHSGPTQCLKSWFPARPVLEAAHFRPVSNHPGIFERMFPQKKGVCLRNHNTAIKIRKLTLLSCYHLILTTHSSVVHCPPALTAKGGSSESRAAFDCVSFLSLWSII